MIEGKWFPQGSDLAQPLAIRRAVFSLGRDALDAQAQNVVVYREGSPVGTARLWWAEDSFFLGELGVLPQERGKGFGDLLVRLCIYKAATHGAHSLGLRCPAELAPFFARYGFTAVGGADPVDMRLNPGADLGCCGCGHCG